MNAPTSDDRQLVEAVLVDDPGAFAKLVERHQKLVWHMIYRLVQHPEDTRELSQETFLRVHQRLRQFRFESSLATWIGRIAFSLAVRRLQRKQIPLVEPVVESTESGAFENDPVDRVAADTDIENAHADADLYAKVGQQLEKLPPLWRSIVTLYHLDELSVAEIALVTELPAGTVKSHLYRARRKLREELSNTFGNFRDDGSLGEQR